jgi:MOSC domain-containing protein YiiM
VNRSDFSDTWPWLSHNQVPADPNGQERAVAKLMSVNVGLPKDIAWKNRTVYTGAWKTPVTGRRMVRRLNIDGDGQGDLAGHGGENRAVLVYQLDSYRHWAKEFHRGDLGPGLLGENLTVEGLPDDEVCIGDRYRIGQAVFEVTQPRVTCYRAGMRIGEPRMAALLVSHRRPGFYCRVITEGEVEAGQAIVKIAAGPERITVAEIDALLYLPGHPRDALQRALRVPALSPGWKASLQSLAEQPVAKPGSGNVGLTGVDGVSRTPGDCGSRRNPKRALSVTGRPRWYCSTGMASWPIDHTAHLFRYERCPGHPQLLAV